MMFFFFYEMLGEIGAFKWIQHFVQHSKFRMLDEILTRLTLSWRRPLSYRNHSIDLLHKSMDWFLYDNGLRHKRVKSVFI